MVKQQFVDKRDETDSVFDSLMGQLTESGKQFEKLLTKEEFHEGCDKIKRGQAKMIKILIRMDKNRVATTAWIRRVEGDLSAVPAQAGVETNKSEIKSIKTAKELRDRKIE